MIRMIALTISLPCTLTALAVDENTVRGPDVPELQQSPHRIVFESYEANNWDLFVINADGTGRENLTNTPEVHELYAQASPDGSKICFLADTQGDGDTVRICCE